jgi:bifunctional non-homologous end joining protein LigD
LPKTKTPAPHPEQRVRRATGLEVPPQLATLVAEPPAGPEWVHETKFDGFRILCRIARGQATLFTRSGQDWTAHFESVARAAAALPVKSAWLDGEVTVVLGDGRSSFGALQNRGEPREGQQLVYFVFDLLERDGHDLRPLPLEERKRALATLLAAQQRRAPGPLRYVDHIDGDGAAFFARACREGLEGIVSKRRDRAYLAGRSLDWVKTKCMKRQEFVIGGFTEPKGAREGLGALLVGVYEGESLRYAGKVGTGFGNAAAADLRRRLEALERATSPFGSPVKPLPRDVHWATPKLLAEISFTEMTSDGQLRHPSFKGLRDDKPPKEVVREEPAPRPARRR